MPYYEVTGKKLLSEIENYFKALWKAGKAS